MALPQFIFGGDTGVTPEQVKKNRAIADALLESATRGRAPQNVGEGLNAIGQALLYRVQKSKAAKGDALQAQKQADIWGSLSGGNSFGTMGTAAAAAESPDAAAASYASTQPSPSSPAGGARAAAGGPSEVYASALPKSFLSTVDRTEGGGDYDTLFGHAQRNGPFSNVRISGMTVGQAIDFASPSGQYGQYVKGKVGRVATPMGRHQIVGTTLRNAASEMGLDPSTPFNQQTQDAIAAHLARKRVASADSMGGKIAALRSEWEGFRHVPDDQMATIVADLQNGGSMPAAPPAAAAAPVQVASLDPSAGVSEAMDAKNTAVGQALGVKGAPQTMTPAAAALIQRQQPTPAPQPGPVQVAQASPPPQMPGYNGPDPQRLMGVLQNEWASPEQKEVALYYLKQAQAAQQATSERAYDQWKTQQGYAREDGRFAIEDRREDARLQMEREKAAREAGKPIEVGGVLVDPQTMKPVYQAPQQPFTLQPGETRFDGAGNRIAAGGAKPGYRTLSADEVKTLGLPPGVYQAGPDDKIGAVGDGKGITIQTGDVGGDGDLRKKLSEGEGKRWSDLQAAGVTAAGLNQDLGVLDELIKIAPQGPVIGRLAEYFPEGTDAGAAFQSIISRAAPGLRVEGSGATSDIEYNGMLASLPRMRNSPEANRLILETMRAKSDINIRRAQIVNDFQNDVISASQARERLNSLNQQSILSPGLKAILGAAGNDEAPKADVPAGLQPGSMHDGYRYKGGDPNAPTSWELAN